MGRKLRTQLLRLPHSQLSRIISTMIACNSQPGDNRIDFLRTQAPEYAGIIRRIWGVERQANGSLVREYQETVGENGEPPREGYLLAIVGHTRSLEPTNYKLNHQK
jgi:hypothetical protein